MRHTAGRMAQLTILAAALVWASPQAARADGINLIANGDFTEGATGFATAYTLADASAESMRPDGTAFIGISDGIVHSAWGVQSGVGGQGDPFMLVNTQTGGASQIWSENISMIPGWSYLLSFFTTNLCGGCPPNSHPALSVRVNGADLQTVVINGPEWVEHQLAFQATAKAGEVEFWSAVWMYTGADLGLDRISLTHQTNPTQIPTPEPMTLVTLGTGLFFLARNRRRLWSRA